MSKALRNLSLAAFEAAIGWKLMYHVCSEPRQFWAWCNELELAFVLAERARVEEAGMVLLPRLAESLHPRKEIFALFPDGMICRLLVR